MAVIINKNEIARRQALAMLLEDAQPKIEAALPNPPAVVNLSMSIYMEDDFDLLQDEAENEYSVQMQMGRNARFGRRMISSWE